MIYHPSDTDPSFMLYIYRITKDFQVCTPTWWSTTQIYVDLWEDAKFNGYFRVQEK